MTHPEQQTGATPDVIVIGAGFAGLYMVYKLREQGFSLRCFEAGGSVGGTWYWNRYPGARCDIPSLEYSYSFSPEVEKEWRWSEKFATQPEILAYANFVADRLDLRGLITLETRVTAAEWDDRENLWIVETDRGETLRARFVIGAAGCLSSPKPPDLPGVNSFAGETYHTAAWPLTGVDFTGKRVAVIGTGSSAIQAIPLIAEQAAQLTVFQRTPNFSVPARNRPLTPEDRRLAESDEDFRLKCRNGVVLPAYDNGFALDASEAAREAIFQRYWDLGGPIMMRAFDDLVVDQRANDFISQFLHRKIRELVRDPAVADALCPVNHPFGTKRVCVDTNYFAAFNRDNVSLVDLTKTPIENITPEGIVTSGELHSFDALVLATGFDAITGAMSAIEIRGRHGQTLAGKWREGAHAYLGLAVADFPNLFIITGPGSPSVLSNVIMSIEQHVEWIGDCLSWMRKTGYDVIAAQAQAERAWAEHVHEVASATLYPHANSWYLGANVPGKTRLFLPYIGSAIYREKCAEVVADGYRGFEFSRTAADRPSMARGGLKMA